MSGEGSVNSDVGYWWQESAAFTDRLYSRKHALKPSRIPTHIVVEGQIVRSLAGDRFA